jgi:uncharacterized protein DUF4157
MLSATFGGLLRREPASSDPSARIPASTRPLLRSQRAQQALGTAHQQGSEAEADEIAGLVAGKTAASGDAESLGERAGGEPLAPSLRGRLEPVLGWSLGTIRIHADDAAGREAAARGALAFTRGNDVYFSPGTYQPATRAGLALLGHELAHVRQQSTGLAPWASLQTKEDWDFTRADYTALKAAKGELKFGADSSWFPKALQANLLTTLKFTLASKDPVRTEGVNVEDSYHGHFVVPKGKRAPLDTKLTDFKKKSEELQGKALGGKYYDTVTEKNLPAYTKAMQETEKLASPILDEALKIPGAAVIYHTFESNMPAGMKSGSPTRNIRTPMGGTPAGYDPSGTELSANQYTDEFDTILQFAFLVDENGVIHVTVSTTANLSRVTGTPMK